MSFTDDLAAATARLIRRTEETLAKEREKESHAVNMARETGNSLYTAGNFWEKRRHVELSLAAANELYELLVGKPLRDGIDGSTSTQPA